MGFVASMLPVVATLIAILFGKISNANGFVPKVTTIVRQQNDARVYFGLVIPSALSALVYGADGSVVEDEAFENPDSESTINQGALLDYIKRSLGADGSLVWRKIACAFAPPPHHTLTPEAVQDAFPVGISDDGIDIALAVPASEDRGGSIAAANQLVQVLVTVRFPQAWAIPQDGTTDEKGPALLGQIRILENNAMDRLSQQRKSSDSSRDNPRYYENLVIEQRREEQLQQEPTSSKQGLPEWWTTIDSQNSSMMDEARLLKKLLNEAEFEDDLRALFVKHINESGATFPVLRAAVSSIGSSGLFLKSRVVTGPNGGEIENEKIANVTIPYDSPPHEVLTATELREGVLLLVESVDPMPAPVQPLPIEISKTDTEVGINLPYNEQVMEQVNNLENKTAGDDLSLPIDTKTNVQANAGARLKQPRPAEEEAKLAAKYAAIEDLGERAFTILRDLEMI